MPILLFEKRNGGNSIKSKVAATDLRYRNNLPICTPASLFQELGDLRRLARTCLADNYDHGKRLYEIQQTLSVLCDREERGRLVERRDESRPQIKLRHDYAPGLSERPRELNHTQRKLFPRPPGKGCEL